MRAFPNPHKATFQVCTFVKLPVKIEILIVIPL